MKIAYIATYTTAIQTNKISCRMAEIRLKGLSILINLTLALLQILEAFLLAILENHLLSFLPRNLAIV